MRFDTISLFPDVIASYCSVSIVNRAIQEKYISIYNHDLRTHGLGKHRKVDDKPYGGGDGLLLMPAPVLNALDNIPKTSQDKSKLIVLTPRGHILTQPFIKTHFLPQEQLIIICPRYEGIDERIIEICDYPISLGNYILTGGELGAMIIIDSVTRLIEGVLTKYKKITDNDSFADTDGRYIEYPQYTQPRELLINNKLMSVPDVLLNGNHAEITKWQSAQSCPAIQT